jgi:hypothetical protein
LWRRKARDSLSEAISDGALGGSWCSGATVLLVAGSAATCTEELGVRSGLPTAKEFQRRAMEEGSRWFNHVRGTVVAMELSSVVKTEEVRGGLGSYRRRARVGLEGVPAVARAAPNGAAGSQR